MTDLVVNQELLVEDAPRAMPEGVYPSGDEIPPDRVLLFEVNGRQYTVPKRVNPNVVFRYLRAVRREEGERAIAEMMYQVLGEGVIDALADEDLSDEQMAQVMKVVRRHVMGATEATLGNSSNGQRR